MFILTWAGTDSITRMGLPYLFRPSLSSWQLCVPMAKWYYENVGKSVVLVAADFAAGHDVMNDFKSGFQDKGKIIKELYPPIGTPDYSSYLTEILSLNPPGVFCFFTGTDAVRFVQQYAQFGLKGRIRLTGFAPVADGTTIPAQGQAALGAVTSEIYLDTLDNPVNKEFVADYRKRYHASPDTFSDYGFVTAQCIDEAVKATDGDTSNKDDLAKAMSKVAFAAPRGPFRFDPVTHNPIQNVYIAEVMERHGHLVQEAISTIKNVRDPGKA